MASSSSSSASSYSQCSQWNYDVFLSFRGEDTRKTFTSHLYKDLDRMGIVTFQDDKRLELGSSIPFELCKAIEESQFAVVIFSKNYASSGWCLDELVKIMKCKNEYGQTVIPVFYDVDPSTVRRQRESFAEAFTKHESRYNDVEGMHKVQGWRSALTEAANLSGHDIRNRIEAECIQKIVEEVSSKLRKNTHLSSLQDDVGMNTHLEKVKSLLKVEIDDVRIVGIWGMGGIGKTTIARAIFYILSDKYEAACLLADVKENEKRHQLHSLQNTLLSDLLKSREHHVKNKHDGKRMMSSRLRSKKVLIVLDDIDHIDHMEYLAGDLRWFGKGSRVIITTRNKHLIENDDALYEVTALPHREAIQLFYQHAFRKEVPDERFEKLSGEVVNHAKGLPLALKVWGSFLHKRNIIEWQNAIEQMKNSVNSEIVEKLKISYDGLEPIQQEMFLDIACFFRGQDKDFVIPILKSCFGASIGLSVLIEKSLVVISEYNEIEMHDLIQDMGKYVVNVQKNPGKRSRLWLAEDIKEVMTKNKGTDTIEAIWIKTPSKLQISKKALKHMDMLRMLLFVYDPDYNDDEDENADNEDEDPDSEDADREVVDSEDEDADNEDEDEDAENEDEDPDSEDADREVVDSEDEDADNEDEDEDAESEDEDAESEDADNENEDEDADNENEDADSKDEPANNEDVDRISFHDDTFKYLSNNLSCFVWNDYHGESMPPNFEPKGLVHLELSSSSLRHLWNGRKDFRHLRKLHLSNSRRLIETPDFRGMPNLEYLDLSYCCALEEVHPSLGLYCTKLIRLDLLGCTSLKRFPCVNMESLEYLRLEDCKSLEKFPEIIGSMKLELEIHMQYSGIRELPSSSFQYPTHMTKLCLRGISNIVTLPNCICKLRSLVVLDVSYCKQLESLPEEIGDLENLEELHASWTLISRPPSSIVRLNKLTLLGFSKFSSSERHFVFPRVNQGLRSLEELNLSCCNLNDGGLPEDIGCLSSLKRLYLREINCDCLPRSIAQIGALEFLDLSYCKRLGELPELPPNVEELWADYPMDQSIQNCENLKRLVFIKRSWAESDDAITDLFAKTLLKCILSLRKAQRVFYMWHPAKKIPVWLKCHNEPENNLLVKLPENWYANDNFLGFAIFYSGCSYDVAVELILSNDDGLEKLSKKLSVVCADVISSGVNFYFIPLASLWDTSKANGNTPNVYGHLKFSLPVSVLCNIGFHLLYKDDPELEALLQEIEDDPKSAELCIGIKRSRYDNGEHHDSMTDEASCSYSKKQMSHSNIRRSSMNLPQQEEGPSISGLLQLFPENPGS